MNKNINEIMYELDSWVSRHGTGGYMPTYTDVRISIVSPLEKTIGMIFEPAGIQQVREEIKDFASVLMSNNKTECILEIGLGHYGSTHFLWRLLFDKVVTIEKYFERVREFGRSTKEYYGKWVLDDGKSFFIDGLSHDTKVVMYTYRVLHSGIDALFIDGDHTYEGVLTDWLLYSPLVKPGGIIAFHDSMLPESTDVPKFLTALTEGKIDGKKREIHHIIKSNFFGIGYYIKGE